MRSAWCASRKPTVRVAETVPRRNLYGSLAVLAVVAAISLGLPALDHSLPGDRPVTPGVRITVGSGVTVLPPSGSVVDVTHTFPSRGILAVDLDGVRVLLEASHWPGDLAGLAARLRRKIQSNPGYQASAGQHEVHTTAGVPGLSGSYSSPGRDGRFLVFATGGIGVEVTLAGNQADLRQALSPVLTMVDSIRFGGGR